MKTNTDKELSPEYLRSIIAYNPQTGCMTWRERIGDAWFNSRWAGKPATCKGSGGYRRINITTAAGKHCHYAHRIAWTIHYGAAPEGVIDHINQSRADNRVANLRDVSHSENSRNAKLRSTNKSGYNGVHWNSAKRRWEAQAYVAGQRVGLGLFQSKPDAVAARAAANTDLGFHDNHGKVSALA